MNGYTDPFGGGVLQPAQVGYRAIALVADLTLVWPAYATEADTPAADIMDVTSDSGSHNLVLPVALQVSTGTALTIRNTGSFSFQVRDADGNSLATVTAGAVRYLYLQDNSTVAGAWASILLGVGSSNLDASQLVGLGLLVQGNTLAWGPITGTLNVDTTLDAVTDRAAVYVWIGGNGTITLPSLVDAGVDFVVEVRNQGSGVLTIAPVGGSLIDASSTIELQVNESGFIHGGPAAWYTVGRGRNAQFNFTRLAKAVTGGTVTLSLTEASNVVQTYTGTLVSNLTLVVPAVVQVYYISNATTGAYTFTVESPVVGGAAVAIPTGTNAVLFCDGTDVINCTTSSGGSFNPVLIVGSVGAPSLSFSGDPGTGLYQPISGSIGYAISGVLRVLMNAAGIAVAGDISGTTIGGVTPGPVTATNLTVNTALIAAAVTLSAAQLSYLYSPYRSSLNSVPAIIRTAVTLYVRTDGSDSNTGLVNNAGGAFLTNQHALDVATTLLPLNCVVTVKMGNSGNFAGGVVAGGTGGNPRNLEGIVVQGDTGTPANTIVTSPITSTSGAAVRAEYYKIATTDLNGLVASAGGYITIGAGMDFGDCGTGSHVFVADTGTVYSSDNYTISGDAYAHMQLFGQSLADAEGATVTLTGTPNFTGSFIEVTQGSHAIVDGMTYSGPATGTRFAMDSSSAIQGGGLTLTTFPGNVDGVVVGRYQSIFVPQAPVAVTSLPALTASCKNARAFVLDSSVTTFGSVVANGGANGVPVYWDGTNWRVG